MKNKELISTVIMKYNEQGKLIYKNDDEEESSFEYDEKGNAIHTIITNKEQNIISHLYHEYDEKGNEILCKDENGKVITSFKYDLEGRETHSIDSDGTELFYDYDDEGNLRNVEMTGPGESPITEWIYEYDEKGNMIHQTCFKDGKKDDEFWYDNNEKGNTIHIKNVSGDVDFWYEYDEHDNVIHIRSAEGTEDIYENKYDEKGNLVEVKVYR